MQVELARVKGAHAFLQQQHQKLKRRWEPAEQQRSASASTSEATQGVAKRQRRANEPLRQPVSRACRSSLMN